MGQYKTRYVGGAYTPQTSSGDAVAQAIGHAGQALTLMAAEKQKAIDKSVKEIGLDQPLPAIVPKTLNEKFAQPAQEILSELTAAATQAKLDPSNATAVNKYRELKQEYEEFVVQAEQYSKKNNETIIKIQLDSFSGLSGTTEEAKQLYSQWNSNTLSRNGWQQQLQESGLFIPPIQGDEVKYTPQLYSDAVIKDMGPRIENFRTKEFVGAKGYYTGAVDEDGVKAEIAKRLNTDIATDESLKTAISYSAWLREYPGAEWTKDAESKAITEFNPRFEGKKVVGKNATEISTNGDFVVTDDDIKQSDLPEDEKHGLLRYRQAKKQYVDILANEVITSVTPANQSQEIEVARKEKAKKEAEEREAKTAAEEERKQKEKEKRDKERASYPAMTPDANGDNFTLALDRSVGGSQVVSVTFDSSGEIVSYQATGQTGTPVSRQGGDMDQNVLNGLKNIEIVQQAKEKAVAAGAQSNLEERRSAAMNPGMPEELDYENAE